MSEKRSNYSRDKTKQVLKTITLSILENLFLAMDGIIMHNISRHQAYGAIIKSQPNYSKSDSARVLENLKRRGYITKMQDENGNVSVRFTAKAQMKLVDKITSSMKLSQRYHFMSFDIPETYRHKRDKFRSIIKRMGFKQIQQSLWTINKDVGELVQMAAKECEVEDYVVYIVSAMSDIDSQLDKKFQK